MRWLIIAIALLGGILALRFVAASPATAPTRTPAATLAEAEQFAALIGQPGHVLLDLRTPPEHAAGYIAQTDHLIDFEADDFAKKIGELPRDKTYLIYCRSGRRSRAAAAQMKSLGFERIVDLKGGMNAWQQSGRPVQKSP